MTTCVVQESLLPCCSARLTCTQAVLLLQFPFSPFDGPCSFYCLFHWIFISFNSVVTLAGSYVQSEQWRNWSLEGLECRSDVVADGCPVDGWLCFHVLGLQLSFFMQWLLSFVGSVVWISSPSFGIFCFCILSSRKLEFLVVGIVTFFTLELVASVTLWFIP